MSSRGPFTTAYASQRKDTNAASPVPIVPIGPLSGRYLPADPRRKDHLGRFAGHLDFRDHEPRVRPTEDVNLPDKTGER